MKKTILPFLCFLLLASSCYNYDGPTRQARELTTPNSSTTSSSAKTISVDKKSKESAEAYLVTVAKAIKKAIPSSQIQMLQDSIKVLFPDNIQYGKSGVIPEYDVYTELRKLAGLIIKYDRTNVLVVGHSDKGGNEQVNKKLSKLRAQYIQEVLLAYKTPEERLNSWGIGSSSPIASELIPGGKEKNRRVEFVILATANGDDGEY